MRSRIETAVACPRRRATLTLALSRGLLLLTVCAHVVGQLPATPASAEQITTELTEVLALPSGSDNLRATLPRLGRFLDKYRGEDLARFGYAPAVYLFLNGDYEAAVHGLETYFERYARLPVPGHDRIVGQVYVNAIREEATQLHLDPTRVQGFALRALDLQQSPVRVGSAVCTVLDQCASGDAARVRLVLVRRLLADAKLDDSERDRALRSLYRKEASDATIEVAGEPVDARVTALSGHTIDLRALRGRVVLLHFWASWCPVTAAEAPVLVQAYEQFHTQGFDVVGIAVDASDSSDVLSAARTLKLPWDQVHEKGLDGAVAQRLGIESLPDAVLLDRRGVPCARGNDARGQALLARLAGLLAN